MATKKLSDILFAGTGGGLSAPWDTGNRLSTLHGLSKQKYGVTGRPGRVSSQRAAYHGLGLDMMNPQPYETTTTHEPEIIEVAPTPLGNVKPAFEGAVEAEAPSVDWGKTPGEALSLRATMGDVWGQLQGMISKGASKGTIAALLGVPAEYLTPIALQSIATPAGLAKFFANYGLPAALASKEYAPKMQEIFDPYGEAFKSQDISEDMWSEESLASAAQLDQEAYAEWAQQRVVPNLPDIRRLNELYGEAKKSAIPYTTKFFNWVKEKIGGLGDRNLIDLPSGFKTEDPEAKGLPAYGQPGGRGYDMGGDTGGYGGYDLGGDTGGYGVDLGGDTGGYGVDLGGDTSGYGGAGDYDGDMDWW